MKRTAIVFLCCYIGAAAANLGPFWWGDSAAGWQFWVTAVYAAACLLCLWISRDSLRWMRHGLVWSLVSVAGGVFCLLARHGIAWSVIPALILGGSLFAPLYGVTHWALLEDWDVFCTLMTVLGALWAAVCALRLRRLKRRKHETES